EKWQMRKPSWSQIRAKARRIAGASEKRRSPGRPGARRNVTCTGNRAASGRRARWGARGLPSKTRLRPAPSRLPPQVLKVIDTCRDRLRCFFMATSPYWGRLGAAPPLDWATFAEGSDGSGSQSVVGDRQLAVAEREQLGDVVQPHLA